MARLARVVVPGLPYHVTHRGNRRGRIFFEEEDRESYLAHLERYSRQHGLAIWAWCLMTNHVHLIVVPETKDSMGLALGNAHGKYAQWVNPRRDLTGHLWEPRTLYTHGRLLAAWSLGYSAAEPTMQGLPAVRWSQAR